MRGAYSEIVHPWFHRRARIAQTPNYTITQIAATGNAPSPRPINNYGQVVYNNANGAFLWTNGTPVSLGFTRAAINDRGQVAGTTAAPNVVIWSPNTPNGTTGSATAFLNAISAGSQATGINNYGQVTGQDAYTCVPPDYPSPGFCYWGDSFLWTPSSPNGTTGTVTADESALVPFFTSPFLAVNDYGQAIGNNVAAALYTPTAPNAATGSVTYIRGLSQSNIPQDHALAINNSGQITGNTGSLGFVWTPTSPNSATGSAVAIPFLAGFSTMQPMAINARGQVVGTQGGSRPFLYQNGTVFDLGTLRGDLSNAIPVGINDRGQIVLNSAAGGVYLLTPSPPPAPGSVAPASGTGATTTLTFTFNDPRGWQDLGVVNILMNGALDARNACYLAYSVPASTLYLVNDAGQAGGPFAGAATFETGNAIQNSQCSVRPVAVSGNGNALTLTLAFTFLPAFNGNEIVFLAASDAAQNNSGWAPLGVWQVPGGTQTTTTSVLGMAPASGGGLGPTQYTFQFADTKGASDLGVVNILINTALDGRRACYLAYSRPFNTLFLVNDNGDALLPGKSLITSGSLSNSQCSTVSWGSSPVTTAGTNLTLSLSIGFSPGFGPNLIFYLAARDWNDVNNSGWQASGTSVAQ
jgi:probable HAF family extracellular repeat protein